MNKTLSILAFATMAATCGSITDPAPPPDFQFAVGSDFVLALGQGASTADGSVSVRFTGVPSESRCPSDAVCVWEGFAEVALAVRVEQTQATPVLTTHDAVCCTADTIAGFVFQVRELAPVPRSDQQDIPYVLRLLVTRLP